MKRTTTSCTAKVDQVPRALGRHERHVAGLHRVVHKACSAAPDNRVLLISLAGRRWARFNAAAALRRVIVCCSRGLLNDGHLSEWQGH